jgi:hypothetical protein
MFKEEAIDIFRDRQRKPAKAKAAVEWTLEHPTPDLIPLLLLLHRNAWAGVQGLAPLVQEAIIRCARIDPEPLWSTLEKDWESYRLNYAGQAIAQLADWRQSRMHAILAHPVPFEVWGFARAHAKAFAITESTMHLQEQWRLESHTDPSGSGVGRAKRQRRKAWPGIHELAPVPPKEHVHVIDSSYGTIGGAVTEQLETLCRVDPELRSRLRPGLSRDEVLSIMRLLPRPLTAELVELYQFTDGGAELIPHYRFLSLQEMVEFHNQAILERIVKASDLPILEWNGDQWIAAALQKEPSKSGKIYAVAVEDASRVLVAKSFAEFLSKVVDAFRRRRFQRGGDGAVHDSDPTNSAWL